MIQILTEMGYTREIHSKSLKRKLWQKLVFNKGKAPPMFSWACSLTKNDAEFPPVEISSGGFFDHQNYIKKSESNIDISTSEITPKKVRENNVDCLTIKITLKKAREKDVGFWNINFTSKKIRRNDVEHRRNLVFDVSK